MCFLQLAQWLQVTFLLWDTAGQEEYDAITRAYYKASELLFLAPTEIPKGLGRETKGRMIDSVSKPEAVFSASS